MSTPIAQLPPGQPIANDPFLVQQILRESNPEINSQHQQPQEYVQQYPQKASHLPFYPNNPSIPKFYPKQSYNIDYPNLIKKILLVACLVFISQLSSIKQFIGEYVSNKDLNILIRSLSMGFLYIGLDVIF